MNLIQDVVNKVLEKVAVIKSEDGQFALYSRDGTRKLGTHPTYQEALAQEKAIQANKHKHKEY